MKALTVAWATLTAIGTWIMGAFALGVVVLAWNSSRNPALRRTVGILWDIGSFLPRAAHPLAPPSYGERAIPELAQRVTTLTGSPSPRVVLSGHSQGSVMVVATVLHLPAETVERVDLLTHGSPVRRLYLRFFPAYFGPDALRAAYERLNGRWRNLYRDTDPIGAWALDPPTVPNAPVDRRLVDPRTLDAKIQGHSDDWSDAGYARAPGRPFQHRTHNALSRRLSVWSPSAPLRCIPLVAARMTSRRRCGCLVHCERCPLQR